jgi:5'-3' exonuclease
VSTIAAIDLAAIYWRHWHATGADSAPDAAARATATQVRDIARRHDHAAVCLDSGKSWRRELYDGDESDVGRAICAAYKATRDEKPPAALDQLRRVREQLDADGLHLLGADGYEADDVIAGVVEWARAAGHEVVIATADKDLGQLVGEGVTWLRTDNGDTLDDKGVAERYGVLPERLGDWLALVGDKSDNVPGVPGVGAKTAAKLLATYDSIAGIVAALRSNDERLAGKLRENLEASQEQLGVARLLVSLRAPKLDYAQIETRRPAKPIAPKLEDMMQDEIPDAEFESVTPDVAPMPQPAPSEPERPRQTPVPQSAPQPTAAIVVAEPGSDAWALALEPQSMRQVMAIADILHQSGGVKLPNPSAVVGAIMFGRNLGLSAMASLQNVHVVEGKFTLAAHAIIGRVLGSPLCEYMRCTTSDSKHATWVTKRRGYPERELTYTIEEATTSGVVKPSSGWVKYPARMLEKECGAMLARLVYPDITAGLYSPEELGGAA